MSSGEIVVAIHECDEYIVGGAYYAESKINSPEIRERRKCWKDNLIGASIEDEIYMLVGENKELHPGLYHQCLVDPWAEYPKDDDEFDVEYFQWSAGYTKENYPITDELLEKFIDLLKADCADRGVSVIPTELGEHDHLNVTVIYDDETESFTGALSN